MTKQNGIGYARGIKAGFFLVLGSRSIGGVDGYQLKTCCEVTLKVGRGEMWLPADKVIFA